MNTRTGMRAAAMLASCGALLGLPGIAAAADPTVQTLPADTTLITDSYALLSGNLNPNGTDVAYRFEWGRTANYGHTTPVTPAGNGKADVPVDTSLDTLKPRTTYHYRLVVLNAKGTTFDGADQSFTTTDALGLVFASAKAHVTSKGLAQVKVTSVGPPDEVAAGKLTLTSRGKAVGSVAYSVPVGARKTLVVRLSKAGRQALAAGKALKVRAVAATSGTAKAARATLKLEA